MKEAKESQKVARGIGSEIYEEGVQLVVPAPIRFEQVSQFEGHLERVKNLKIVWTGGSAGEGSIISVSLQKPVRLIHILNRIPMVEKVNKKGKKIRVMLKTPSLN